MMVSSVPRFPVLVVTMMMVFCSNPSLIVRVKAQDEAETASSSGTCLTFDDVDFESCNLEDLPDKELKEICSRLGLDMETDIFSYVFDEDEDGENDAAAAKKKEEDNETKEWTHKDYVAGAYECLLIEQEFNDSEAHAPDIDDILEEDPQFLNNLIAQLMETDPEIIDEVEVEMKRDHPEFWDDLDGDMKEGETLKDRPDILSQILLQSLRDDPEILYQLFDEEDYDEEEMEVEPEF
mmetsp:Transcript_28053/g.39511  ORF Transcript_28053/g.39511 Transcript_28053/m.39511 type:complete len:237 (+) Transcript_28053:157-867(+)